MNFNIPAPQIVPVVGQDGFDEQQWQHLKAAVEAIHAQQPTSITLQALCKGVANMCASKQSSTLYARLSQQLATHMTATVSHLLGSSTHSPDEFLQLMQQTWHAHCRHMVRKGVETKGTCRSRLVSVSTELFFFTSPPPTLQALIQSIFVDLDRNYVLKTDGVELLWWESYSDMRRLLKGWRLTFCFWYPISRCRDLALRLFREHVFAEHSLQERLINALLENIFRER